MTLLDFVLDALMWAAVLLIVVLLVSFLLPRPPVGHHGDQEDTDTND